MLAEFQRSLPHLLPKHNKIISTHKHMCIYIGKLMTIVIDTEIIELFRIQWWHLQCKFGIKVFDSL